MSVDRLLKIVALPTTGKDGVAGWAEQPDLFGLLEEQRAGPWIMLYGSSFDTGSLLLHSILVPAADLENIQVDDLLSWEGNPWDSWTCGLVWGGGEPPRVEFNQPPSRIGSDALKNGQQLVFGRSFDGRIKDKRYYEIAQFLTHAHGLHWTPERRAWCKLDERGDVEDVICWQHEPGRGGYKHADCITIKREVLEMQMSATGTVLVQMFDSTCVPKGFGGWDLEQDEKRIKDQQRGLYYRSHIEGHNGSYIRGTQVIRPQRSAQDYGAYLHAKESQPKSHESFITVDWKNKRIAMVSCDPKAMASYFDKDSPLPFQTSPVFFNAEVLDKYKADPEKYTLEHRSISCRNAWHLQTYDVNEAGQVHTYIRYLGYLPYSEQQYWKAFNEAPKAGISRRAFATDFEGKFDQEPDSVRNLQGIVLELHGAGAKWFTLRQPELVKQVHYPLTDSPKAWGDTLATLAKLVCEGLERRFFEAKATDLGAAGDAKWGSIRWAQEAMQLSGAAGEVVAEVIEPLRELQELRTKLAAHSSGDEANALRANLLQQFRSPRGHVEHICQGLVHSLTVLRDLYK